MKLQKASIKQREPKGASRGEGGADMEKGEVIKTLCGQMQLVATASTSADAGDLQRLSSALVDLARTILLFANEI